MISSSPNANERRGWLYNPIPSKTPPTSGWQYAYKGTWPHDPTMTISPGPLPPLARQFTVKTTTRDADKKCLGVFTRSEMWWLGRPVYINTWGRFLHHSTGDCGWVIGDALGKVGLRGSRARHSPESEDTWRYWTGSEFRLASVTVTASD